MVRASYSSCLASLILQEPVAVRPCSSDRLPNTTLLGSQTLFARSVPGGPGMAGQPLEPLWDGTTGQGQLFSVLRQERAAVLTNWG